MGAGNTPVVLAAFANDPKRYLGKLRKEQKQIRNALRKAERQGQCRLIERPDATVDEILDVFQEFRDRVVLFHFAGHAGSAELLFESLEGAPQIAHAGGIAAFLSQQRSLNGNRRSGQHGPTT
jgi:hypothetical protein